MKAAFEHPGPGERDEVQAASHRTTVCGATRPALDSHVHGHPAEAQLGSALDALNPDSCNCHVLFLTR